jgi:tRNA threonylcarbamoyladenosine biosynthesis protein TsaB
MLLLAIDTSGRQGGITLARGKDGAVDIIESASIQGGTFSAELIPQVSELLSRNNLTPQQLEGLVAVTGPGSFTGLRVGLTAVKGLAEVLTLPIATITSLEALLAASGREEQSMAALDAGRGELYIAFLAGSQREELLLSLTGALEFAKSRNLRIVVADAALAAKLEDSETVSYRSSEVAAQIGCKKLLAGDLVDVLALDANYIRKSEAEYLQNLKRYFLL